MRTVYLDQLHWIEISRAVHGLPVGEGTKVALAHMRCRANDGELLFPLSLAHYFETLKRADPQQRQRLSAVMRQLSGGNTIADPSTIVRHEIRSALISKLELDLPLAPLKVLGRGMEHALGRSFNFRLEWPFPNKVPDELRQKIELEFFDLLEATFLSGMLHAGEESILWPQINLDADRKFQEHLTAWRGSAARMSADRLLRTVYATTLSDIQQPLCTVLAELGITMEQFANLGEPAWCELLDMMPSRRADMHLRIQWAKNANLKPSSNLSDLNDWVYLGMAVCYCDLVVTENQMTDLLRRADEFAPKATSRLTDLLKF
jgi:hypothetical protein